MKVKVKVDGPGVIPVKLPGVEQKGNVLEFDGRYGLPEVKETCKRLTSPVRSVAKVKAYSPTEQDFQEIGSRVPGTVDASGFGVYQVIASSTRIDTDRDKFGKEILDEMARQYTEGRTVVWGHDVDHGVGKTFAAEVVQAEDGEHELTVKFYVDPETTAKTGNAKRLLDSGIYDRVSIWAYVYPSDYVHSEKSPDGKSYWIFADPEGMIVRHLGIVDMGANTDAVFKSKSDPDDVFTFGEIETETDMNEIEIKIKGLNETAKVSLEEASVKSLVEKLDAEIVKAQGELKKYQEAEAEELRQLRESWSALHKEINPDADSIKLESRAAVLTKEMIQEDLVELKKQAAAKKAKQTDPFKGPEGKKAERAFPGL